MIRIRRVFDRALIFIGVTALAALPMAHASAQSSEKSASWRLSYGWFSSGEGFVRIENRAAGTLDVTPLFVEGTRGSARLELVCVEGRLEAWLRISPISDTMGHSEAEIEVRSGNRVLPRRAWVPKRDRTGLGIASSRDSTALVEFLMHAPSFTLHVTTKHNRWSIDLSNEGFAQAFEPVARACKRPRS